MTRADLQTAFIQLCDEPTLQYIISLCRENLHHFFMNDDPTIPDDEIVKRILDGKLSIDNYGGTRSTDIIPISLLKFWTRDDTLRDILQPMAIRSLIHEVAKLRKEVESLKHEHRLIQLRLK